jgi:hypothetical protein
MKHNPLLAAFVLVGCISHAQDTPTSKTVEKITISIYNRTPDRYPHAYTKNENWNGFFSDSPAVPKSTVRDALGNFYFSVDIDSLGQRTGYRKDLSSDTFFISRPDVVCSNSHRYDTDSIISLTDYGSESGLLLINNLRGPSLANSIRLYFVFPNSRKARPGISFIQHFTKETQDYNPGLLSGISSWRGMAFEEDNHFTNDSLSQPRLSPTLGSIRWTRDDTVTVTKKRLLNGCVLVDGYFSEKLSSALVRPYKGDSFEKTWYMKGLFYNIFWR